MAVNPFANIQDSPYVSLRTALPLDEMKKTGDTFQDRWDVNKAAADDLQSSMSTIALSVADQDREAIDSFNETMRGELEAMAKSGDYHNMTKKINKYASEYAMRVRPAVEEKAKLEAEKEQIRRRNDMTEQDKVAAMEDIDRRYTGVKYDKDLVPIKTSYKPGSYASTVDVAALALDYVKPWKASNLGITEKEVRDALPEALKNSPQLIAYRDSKMNIARNRYAAMVRKGELTQDEMDFRMKEEEQNFERDVINPAIELAVQETAFTNYIKPDKDTDSGSRKGGDAGRTWNVGTTTGTVVPTVKLKESQERLEAARIKAKQNPDDADAQYERQAEENNIRDLYEMAKSPELKAKLGNIYQKYLESPVGKKDPISMDDFDRMVQASFMEDPTGKTRFGQAFDQIRRGEIATFRSENQYIMDGVQAVVKAIKSGDVEMAAESSFVTGSEGTEKEDTRVGLLNKHLTTDFQTTISNYEAVDDGVQLDVELNSKAMKARDPEHDTVTLSDKMSDGKYTVILHTFDENGKPVKQISLAPKNQDVYREQLVDAGMEMVSTGRPAIMEMGYKYLDAAFSMPIVQATKFRERSEGKVPGLFTNPEDPSNSAVVYKKLSDGIYGLFKLGNEGGNATYTPLMGKEGQPIQFSSAAGFARILSQMQMDSAE